MSNSAIEQTREDVEAKASALSLVCYWRHPQELMIDWDVSGPKEAVRHFNKEMMLSKEKNILLDSFITVSKSARHHLYYWLKTPVSDADAITLQLILGSDEKREAMNSLRNITSGDPMMCLFETPDEAFKLDVWHSQMMATHGPKTQGLVLVSH